MTKNELRASLLNDIDAFIQAGGIIETVSAVKQRKIRLPITARQSNTVYQNAGSKPRLKTSRVFASGFEDPE